MSMSDQNKPLPISDTLVSRAEDTAARCTATLIASDLTVFALAWLAPAPAPPGPFLALGFIWFLARGHYTCRLPLWLEMRDLVAAGTTMAIACAAALVTAGQPSIVPALPLWLAIGLGLPAGRLAARRWLANRGWWMVDAVVVGSPAAASRLRDLLRADPSLGYRIAGVFDPAHHRAEALERALTASPTGFVFLAPDHPPGSVGDTFVSAAVQVLEHHHIDYAVVPPIRCVGVDGARSLHVIGQNLLLLQSPSRRLRSLNAACKRVLDIAGSALALLVAAPLCVMVAALVASDGGPVFFAHSRIGRGGRPFPCLKFRSMVPDADAALTSHLASHPWAAAEWQATHKLKDDPRVTRLGHFMRRVGLDELPQLWNVLRGDMSLVGPRPIVTAELHHYADAFATVRCVRPGITGLWQVSGRNDIDYPSRVQLDLWYVRNHSLWLDFVILLKTIPAVLSRRGAY
jgi:undecaprenyl-phosphate galactose phosphotransferase